MSINIKLQSKLETVHLFGSEQTYKFSEGRSTYFPRWVQKGIRIYILGRLLWSQKEVKMKMTLLTHLTNIYNKFVSHRTEYNTMGVK